MKLITWQKNYTQNQAYTWQAFGQIAGEETKAIISAPPSAIRQQHGWKLPDLAGQEMEVLPAEGWWRRGQAILDAYPNAIHLFSGFFGEKKFLPLLASAVWKGRRVCILQEAYATQPVGYLQEEKKWVSALKVFVRPLAYRAAAQLLRALTRQNPPCVLAIGPQGLHQMRQAGFRREQVFPFGYFVPRQAVATPAAAPTAPLRLIFLGALLRRKGLDILVDAVSQLARQGYPLTLDLFGYGNPEDFFSPAAELPIHYGGSLSMEKTQAVLAQYDALVLPSRHDGWGVVVNEALLQGLAVLVSEQSGASCLIRASGAGAVFSSQESGSLTRILRQALENPAILHQWRENARWASEKISPESAAKYVHAVFQAYFFQQSGPPDPTLWDVPSL